jgi:hypothetical protein
MRRTMLAAAALMAGAMALSAQEPAARPEIRPFMGASIPTGTQRDLFNDAPMFGLQGAVQLKPNFHVVGTFGWVPGQNQFVLTRDNVNIFQYDVGLELGMVRALGGNWQFKPYLGIGGGARTYAYEADQLADRTCAAGYGALGSEFQVGRTAFRVEARDDVFCFKSPIAGQDSKTRNDIRLTAGVAFHLR